MFKNIFAFNRKTVVYQWIVFVAAFLLFSVQPLISKFILPWFGGSSSVWISAMMFFQVILLAGYATAYLISHLKRPHQFFVYVVILLAAVFFLPIIPDSTSGQVLSQINPSLYIFWILLASVGLPYFILALSSPLLQSWYADDSESKVSPYRLYAFSNGGSLLGLLSYPILIEPLFDLEDQTKIWSVIFIAFVSGAFFLSLKWRNITKTAKSSEQGSEESIKKPTLLDRAFWVLLPFAAVIILLSVTNYITQDLVAVPFLWILPLVLYLLSFIITFYSREFYDRRFVFPIFIIASLLSVPFMFVGKGSPLFFLLGVPLVITMVHCTTCHGELYRLRPGSKYLTSFYLYLSLGGALGGIFVSLLSPIILKLYFELHFAIVFTLLLIFVLWLRDKEWLKTLKRPRSSKFMIVSVFIFIFAALLYHTKVVTYAPKYIWRDFYGVVRIYESKTEKKMYHGSTLHGTQFLDAEKECLPTAYYGYSSGLGQVVEKSDKENLKVGVVGLGVGTAAVYGDYVRFYELNPHVAELAESEFTFLSNCAKNYDILLGDGRLLLEKEEDQNFDILVLDAFSSDNIPAHLLTKEAFATYLRHIGEKGVIAVHISNRYIDLEPVIGGIASEYGLEAAIVEDKGDIESSTYKSHWAILTYDKDFLTQIEEKDVDFDKRVLWTDKYSNLFNILRFE